MTCALGFITRIGGGCDGAPRVDICDGGFDPRFADGSYGADGLITDAGDTSGATISVGATGANAFGDEGAGGNAPCEGCAG